MTDITGIVLTKLDGTARAVSLWRCRQSSASRSNMWVWGEHIEDLQKFSPDEFVDALFYVNE